MEPGRVVRRHRDRPPPRRGVAAPDALPARHPGGRGGAPGRGAAGGRPRRTATPARLYGSTDPVEVPTLHATLAGTTLRVRASGPVQTRTRLERRGRARGVRRRAGRPPHAAADGVVLLVPLLRGRHRRRRRRGPGGLRRARPRGGRGADRRRLEPGARRGAGGGRPVRPAPAARRPDPRVRAPRRALAGAVPGRCGHHARPRAPRLADRPGRLQLGPGPGRPRPRRTRPSATCSPATSSGWWRSAWTTSSWTSCTPGRWRACRRTAPGWSWSARPPAPTS